MKMIAILQIVIQMPHVTPQIAATHVYAMQDMWGMDSHVMVKSLLQLYSLCLYKCILTVQWIKGFSCLQISLFIANHHQL